MKKRILSLIMAVCMVAAVVPAMLISLTAADSKGFSTALELGGDNYPTFVEGQSFSGFNGNWTMSKFAEGKLIALNDFDKAYSILKNGNTWGQTDGSFIYLNNGTVILASRSNIPNVDTRYYVQKTDGSGYGSTSGFVYTYEAPYEGTVKIGFKAMAAVLRSGDGDLLADGEVAAVRLGIFINGSMIWPTKGATMTDGDKFAVVTDMDHFKKQVGTALDKVQVNVGDKIQYVFGRETTAGVSAAPEITWADGYVPVPTRLAETFNTLSNDWPVARNVNGYSTVKQTSATWKLGDYDLTAGKFIEYPWQRRQLTEAWAGRDRELLEGGKYNGIYLYGNDTILGGYNFGTEDAGKFAPTYQYTSIAHAKADLSLTNLRLSDNNLRAAKNASAKMAVYKNGTLLKEVTVSSDANGVVSVSAMPTGVELVKGDVLHFVASAVPSEVKVMCATPVVSLYDITSFTSGKPDTKYFMEVADAKVVADNTVGLSFIAYANKDVYLDSTEVGVYVWDKTVSGEKTAANAVATLTMTLNRDFSYSCVYDGFSPKEIADTLYVQVYAKKGNEVLVQSAVTEMSVMEKVYNQFNATTDIKEQEMLAGILNYGAAAQVYFNYNTENLANAKLDNAFKGLVDLSILYYAKFDGEKIGTLISASELRSFALIVDSKISIRIYADISDTEKTCPIYLQHGADQDTMNADRVGLKMDSKNSFLIDNIGLRELSEVHHMRLCVQNGRVRYYGYHMTYSVESFAARMMDSDEKGLPELVCAMMELSKAIAAYNA